MLTFAESWICLYSDFIATVSFQIPTTLWSKRDRFYITFTEGHNPGDAWRPQGLVQDHRAIWGRAWMRNQASQFLVQCLFPTACFFPKA